LQVFKKRPFMHKIQVSSFTLKTVLIGIVFIAFGMSSCSKYQKVLKSTDLPYKLDMAMKYYEDGEYYRAEVLYEELIGLYRGLGKAEEIYYYHAYCNYYMEDYIMAGYYFDNFIKTYPTSKHAEECRYMSAYCYYMNSPEYSLDQSNTVRAIEELQLFINRYPNSERVAECNDLMDVLRNKLEKKAYENAMLYFHLGSYKASIVSFNNVIVDYPDSKYKEQSYFYILKSHYLLASNSIESKKKERFNNAVNAFYDFQNYQPVLSDLGDNSVSEGVKTRLAKEAESIYNSALKDLETLEAQIN